MPRKLPAVLLAVLLLTSGCLGILDSRPESDQRAVDLRERTSAAVNDTTTYQFDMDSHISASDGDQSTSISVTGSGAVDSRERLLRVTTSADDTTRRVYVENYTRYTECADPWDGWGVEELDAERSWADYAPLGRQLAILEHSRVYWGENETLDGNRTVVLVAHPTAETLQNVADSPGRDSPPVRGLKNATLTMHVNPETALPERSRLRVKVEQGGATGTATVTFDFRNYGRPANVSVPPSTVTDQHELGCPGTA